MSTAKKQEYKKPEISELSSSIATQGMVIPGPKGSSSNEGVGVNMTMGSGTTAS